MARSAGREDGSRWLTEVFAFLVLLRVGGKARQLMAGNGLAFSLRSVWKISRRRGHLKWYTSNSFPWVTWEVFQCYVDPPEAQYRIWKSEELADRASPRNFA